MLQDQGLRNDGTCTAWAEQLREGDEEVDGEDEQFVHGANRIMTAVPRKTARRRWMPSYYEFATHRGLGDSRRCDHSRST